MNYNVYRTKIKSPFAPKRPCLSHVNLHNKTSLKMFDSQGKVQDLERKRIWQICTRSQHLEQQFHNAPTYDVDSVTIQLTLVSQE